MKMTTINLEDAQEEWLKNWGGNKSELIRGLLSSFINKSKNSGSIEDAMKSIEDDSKWDAEYETVKKEYFALPSNIQSEVWHNAKSKPEIQKVKYISKEYWSIIFNTAKEMGVI